MITKNPYGTNHIIKPGCLPEPMKPVRTCDPPESMAIYLSCTRPNCNPESHSCPLRGAHEEKRGASAEESRAGRENPGNASEWMEGRGAVPGAEN